MKLSTIILCASLSTNLCAQDFYSETIVQDIKITFAQSNWDALLDAEKAGNDGYLLAQSVSINGVVFDSVGVKYKGNSTYNANQTKNPFHIELDTYKEQDYQGYKDIKLSNVAKDPSFLREVLSYKILRQYMDAPKSNYANVTVNGSLIGLYSNSEAISKTFLESRFDDKNNEFFKCNPPAGAGPSTTVLPDLVYLGTDSTLYYDGYELKSDYGWQALINLCDSLENNINSIEDILDVDRALYMIAFDNVLVNLDSYIGGFAQNYYLYKDDFNKFLPIVWDLNESFGRFSSTGNGNLNTTVAKQQMDHLLNSNDANYPLISQLLNIPLYKRMYLAHCKTILLENFDDGSYLDSALILQSVIDASVQADQNKFFTYANFTANLTTDINSGGGPGATTIPGISNLMDSRSSYLLSQSDFTPIQPSISNVNVSNQTPALNDIITITADVTDETDVYIGFRNGSPEHFTRVLMHDDGLHNDNASGDGIYGIQLTISDLNLEYYIYADNNNIGRFLPARAEHEYFTISAIAPSVGDIVINEFQASNSTTVSDQDGEFNDWIELYNNSFSTILLDTMFLSDDVHDLMKWPFPAGTAIGSNSYFIVWADNDVTQIGNHANFKLSASGESLFLTNSNGNIVDQVVFSDQNVDETYGRYPNGTGAFKAMVPTFSAENSNILNLNFPEHSIGEVTLYPNPANDFFILESKSKNLSQQIVNIYNVLGKIMYSEKFQNSKPISILDWPSGLYLVIVGEESLGLIVK